jgi:cytoskeletal protein RodZ
MDDLLVDIGALLRGKREERGISLEDAARQTRIRKSYLSSMEENRFDELPGKAYATGFLKVYARFLGLDAVPLLKRLDELAGESSTVAPIRSPLAGHSVGSAHRSGQDAWSHFLVGFIVVLLLGAGLYFQPWFFQRQEQPERPHDVPAAGPPALQPPAPSIAREQADGTDKEASEDANLNAQESASAESTVAPANGSSASQPGARPGPQEPVKAEALPGVPAKGAPLRMLALSDASLIIQVDERKPRRYTLRAGLDLTWRLRRTAVVELDKPGAARFWLAGRELEVETLKEFELLPEPGE